MNKLLNRKRIKHPNCVSMGDILEAQTITKSIMTYNRIQDKTI